MASFDGAILKIMVAKICSNVGYNAITEDPVNILVDLYRKTFIHLAVHCKEAANNNRRVEPTMPDLIQAFDHVGIPVPGLLEYAENVKIPFDFKIESDPELRPFNRIQRDSFVDDLLETEKNQGQGKADNDGTCESNAANDTGSDAEDNNMTPLLKDIYHEISTQFPNPVSPIKADKLKIKREEKLVIPKLKITPLDPSIAEPPSFLPILDGANPEDQSFASAVLHPTPPPLAEKPRRGRQKGTKLKLKSKVKTTASARATANASAKAVAKAKGRTTKAKLKANVKTQLKTKTKGRQKRAARQSAAKAPPPELPAPSPEPSPPTPVQASPSPPPIEQKIQTPEDALLEAPVVKQQQQTKTKKKKKRSSNQFAIVTETVKSAPVESVEEKEWLCPHCSGPDDGDLMVGCDMCELWYHLRCTNLKKPPKDDEDWRCSKCISPKASSRSTPKPSTSKTTPTKPKSARGRRQTQPPAEAPVKVVKTPKPVEHHTPTPPPPSTPQPTLQAVVSEPQQIRPTVICTSQDDLCPECQLPDDGTLMIQCDDPFCAKWFHGKCVNVLMEPSENESWFCKVCVEKQQSAFQRRRRAI